MGKSSATAWWDGADWKQMHEQYREVMPCLRVAIVVRKDGVLGVASEWSPPLAITLEGSEAETELHAAIDEMARVMLRLMDSSAAQAEGAQVLHERA